MQSWIKRLAVTAAALLVVAPVAAQTWSPDGMWVTGPKDVRLEFQLCGEQGQELCGWLRDAADKNPRVQRYLNQPVVTKAERVGPQTWKGAIVLSGHRIYGTMSLVEENRLEVDGCAMLIICGKFNLYRD